MNLSLLQTQLVSDFVYIDVYINEDGQHVIFVMEKSAEPNHFMARAIMSGVQTTDIRLKDTNYIDKIVVPKDVKLVIYPEDYKTSPLFEA